MAKVILDFSGDAWLDKQFKEITLTSDLNRNC